MKEYDSQGASEEKFQEEAVERRKQNTTHKEQMETAGDHIKSDHNEGEAAEGIMKVISRQDMKHRIMKFREGQR